LKYNLAKRSLALAIVVMEPDDARGMSRRRPGGALFRDFAQAAKSRA
jgi:hypothetical protein